MNDADKKNLAKSTTGTFDKLLKNFPPESELNIIVSKDAVLIAAAILEASVVIADAIGDIE